MSAELISIWLTAISNTPTPAKANQAEDLRSFFQFNLNLSRLYLLLVDVSFLVIIIGEYLKDFRQLNFDLERLYSVFVDAS